MGWLWERMEYSERALADWGVLNALPIMKGAGLDTVFMSACLIGLATAFRPDVRVFRIAFSISFFFFVFIQARYWGLPPISEVVVFLFSVFFAFNHKAWFMERIKNLPLWVAFIPALLILIPIYRVLSGELHVSQGLLSVVIPTLLLVGVPALLYRERLVK